MLDTALTLKLPRFRRLILKDAVGYRVLKASSGRKINSAKMVVVAAWVVIGDVVTVTVVGVVLRRCSSERRRLWLLLGVAAMQTH